MDRNRCADSGDFEPLHLPLASTNRQVRILDPIVSPQALLMASRQIPVRTSLQHKNAAGRHQHVGREAVLFEQLAHHCSSLVAPPLQQQIENLTFVVDG
jgi:hypothetical protein